MKNENLMNDQKLAILSRRKALSGMFWLMAGVSMSCNSIKLVFDIKKETVFDDPTNEDCTLRAFVGTVIPGVDITKPHITEVFRDDFYQFRKYKSVFANDLNERSSKLFNEKFEQLSAKDRTKVVADGLDSNRVVSKLYGGAIYLIQIVVYSGVANQDNGCPLIDFKGTYDFEATTYPDNIKFFSESITQTGNPV